MADVQDPEYQARLDQASINVNGTAQEGDQVIYNGVTYYKNITMLNSDTGAVATQGGSWVADITPTPGAAFGSDGGISPTSSIPTSTNAVSGISSNAANAVNGISNTVNGVTSQASSLLNGATDTNSNLPKQATSLFGNTSNTVSSGIGSVESLFNFNSSPSPVVTPNPVPTPVAKLSPTSFQTSPFAEKVLVDPYQTFQLNNLTLPELSIDKTVDYLESLIPTDIISNLKKAPDLLSFLSQKAMSLENFVGSLRNTMPSNFSLDGILRNCGALDLFNNISAIKSVYSNLGVELSTIGPNALATATNYISNIESQFSSASQQFTSLGGGLLGSYGSNSYGSVPYSYNASPIVSTAATLSYVNELAKVTPSNSDILSTVGLNNINNNKLLNSTTSSTFTTIMGAAQTIGASNTANIANSVSTLNPALVTSIYTQAVAKLGTANSSGNLPTTIPKVVASGIAAVTKLGTTNSNAICAMTTTQSAVILSIATQYDTLSSKFITTLTTQIATHGSATIQTIVNDLNTVISTTGVTPLLTLLNTVYKTNSTTALSTATNSSIYTMLISDINAYGISFIYSLAQSIAVSGQATVISLITNISEITPAVLSPILASVSTIQTTMTSLIADIQTLTPAQYTAITDILSTYDPGLISALATANTTLTAAQVLQTINAFTNVDPTVLSKSIIQLANQSTSTLTTIGKLMAVNEPYSIVSNSVYGDPVLLHYAIKESLFIYSLAGNYNAVLNLLINYNGTIVANDLLTVISNLLTNYKQTTSDLLLGLTEAGANLLNALNSIYINWFTVLRNGISIENTYILIGASNDALILLQTQPSTAIGATLVLDNNYTK